MDTIVFAYISYLMHVPEVCGTLAVCEQTLYFFCYLIALGLNLLLQEKTIPDLTTGYFYSFIFIVSVGSVILSTRASRSSFPVRG